MFPITVLRSPSGLILFYAVILFVGIYLAHLIAYTIVRVFYSSDYMYSEKGEKLKQRIDELKGFIEDYSTLDENDKVEAVFWDDFLIYAALFEQNRPILKDMLKLRGIEAEVLLDKF